MADQGLDGAARNPGVGSLRAALHKARIEAADRTGVVVDLRDAEAARLEILNEALDQLFTEIPPGVDLFDRGISQGDTPRLWIDAITDYIAHRIIERDRALVSALPAEIIAPARTTVVTAQPASRFWPFVLGIVIGMAGLFGIALIAALRSM
jgi:hypothetical protein